MGPAPLAQRHAVSDTVNTVIRVKTMKDMQAPSVAVINWANENDLKLNTVGNH
jgi:hypothetical protein